MTGCDLKEGVCRNPNATEHELWDAINHLYQSGHKATTYKFCFFKCLLDLVNGKDAEVVGFCDIFNRFTEIYWELITKYGLSQIYASSKYQASKVEAIIDEFIAIRGLSYNTPFQSLRCEWRLWLTSTVGKQCSNYVVGAFYTNTNCLFYDFSKKDRSLKISSAFQAFCKAHSSILEEVNYYHWAKMLEKINGDSTPKALITKMSNLGRIASFVNHTPEDLPLADGRSQRYSLADIIPWNY